MVVHALEYSAEPLSSLGKATKQTVQAIEMFVKDYLRNLQSKTVKSNKQTASSKQVNWPDQIANVDSALNGLAHTISSIKTSEDRERFFQEIKPYFQECVIAFDRMQENFEELERTFNILPRKARREKEAKFRNLERGYRKGVYFQERLLALMEILDPVPEGYLESEIVKRYGDAAPEVEAAFFRIATAPGFSAEEFKEQFKKNNLR